VEAPRMRRDAKRPALTVRVSHEADRLSEQHLEL
jgi:hypothetical protein